MVSRWREIPLDSFGIGASRCFSPVFDIISAQVTEFCFSSDQPY